MDKTEITNQDDNSKKSATAGGVFVEKAVNSTESIQNAGDNVVNDDVKTEKVESSSKNYSQKPVEIAQQKFYESQKKLNDSKSACWDRFKTIMTVAGIFMGLIIAFLGIFWAYKLSNIAEPIGGIKAEMQFIKDDNKDIKDRIQKNEDRLNELVNKILDRKLSN